MIETTLPASPVLAAAAVPTLSPAQIRALLWREPAARVHAVIDGARVPGLPARLAGAGLPGWDCLRRGAVAPADAERAAYVAELPASSPFTDWLLGEAIVALPGWGVLAASRCALLDAREHFRALACVRLPDGSEREWRWFDPAVLNAFVAAATPAQRGTLAGPLAMLIAPQADQWTCHAAEGGTLVTTTWRLPPRA